MTKRPGNSGEAPVATKCLIAWALALLGCLTSPLTIAKDRFLLEGILDGELHETDAHSLLLSRNDGALSALGRLQLWSAFQISPGLQIYALGEIESDDSSGVRETESEIEQLALRYTNQSAPYYFLEAGKILSPLSVYSNRHLSTQNPLIGQPYVHVTSYPLGVQAAGSSGRLDYRAALVDQPDINPDFIPYEPGSAYRPVLGFGVTVVQGLRFGISYTQGPYLSRQLNNYLPPGTGWRDYDQRVLGLDFQFSRGYLEVNGQLVDSEYDIPFHVNSSDDTTWYVELKYTWTPRLYGALRYGKNEATFIQHGGDLSWLSRNRRFHDLEIGLGYRFSPDTLLKVAYRQDRWDSESRREGLPADGHSLSLQLSHHFDLGSRFVKKR